jgi:hypothetical protein
MAIKQSLWTLDGKKLDSSSLEKELELEELLEKNIGMLDENWLVIGRQVAVQAGFIDLLCIDRAGTLIVIELKKGKTPRDVIAQALDYLSIVCTWEANEIGQVYSSYKGSDMIDLATAFKTKFSQELDEATINEATNAVIVASQMDSSTERIITYLNNNFSVPINILFFHVFSHQNEKILSRVWLLDETEIMTKKNKSVEWNGEYYFSFGQGPNRDWDDAQKYGFVSAGGGEWYTRTMNILHPGDRIWVNIPQKGYVGIGEVTESYTKASEAKFLVAGEEKSFYDLPLTGDYYRTQSGDGENSDVNSEYLVKVKWIKTVDMAKAIKETGFFGNQNTACRPANDKWIFTIDRLKLKFGIIS